jgi:hypothetical protein
MMKRYILRENHPAKPTLDAIFISKRATKDEATFQASGFTTLYARSRSFIRVARHPSLPGYLLKVYLDSEQRQKRNRTGLERLVFRCEGAEKIRKIIQKRKIKHFQVPGKWLYPLVSHSDCTSMEQPFLLIVDDMDLVSKAENNTAWKTVITREHLNELYWIITKAGGASYRPDNIWLTKHGKFAFVDTEYPRQKVDYKNIASYLSDEMRGYWANLTQSQEKSRPFLKSGAPLHD